MCAARVPRAVQTPTSSNYAENTQTQNIQSAKMICVVNWIHWISGLPRALIARFGRMAAGGGRLTRPSPVRKGSSVKN